MTRVRKITVIIMLLAVSMITGGYSKMKNDQRIQIAQEALRQKYGKEFTVLEARSADAGGFYAWARPESRPEIIVRASLNDDGSKVMDDYPVRIICHDLTEKAEWFLKEYEGDCFVFTHNMMEYTIDDINEVTVQRHFIDNPLDKFYIAVFTENDADIGSLYEKLLRIKTGIGCSRGSIDTYILKRGRLVELQKEIERYDEMGSDEVKKIISEGTKFFIDLDPKAEEPSLEEYRRGLEK